MRACISSYIEPRPRVLAQVALFYDNFKMSRVVLVLSLLKLPEVVDMFKGVLERGDLMTGFANKPDVPKYIQYHNTHTQVPRTHNYSCTPLAIPGD